MTTTHTSLPDNIQKIKDKGAKEVLKQLNKWLTSTQANQLANEDPHAAALITHLSAACEALKDTYSPNILRFMTSKEAYIKELVASAKTVQDSLIPAAIDAAKAIHKTETIVPLMMLLIAFSQANQEKQEKVAAGKGDMVEITTHDIMKKNLQKNFADIGQLVEPIITALNK